MATSSDPALSPQTGVPEAGSTTPPAPPPAESQSEDPFERAVSAFEREVRSVLDRFEAGIRRDVADPLRVAIESAAERHRRLVESADIVQPVAPDENGRARIWQQIRTYRGAVRKEVLDPLLDALNRIDGGARIIGLGQSIATGWANLVDAAPSEIRHVEPPSLYAPAGGDPLTWRIRKTFVRSGRSLAARGRRFVARVRRWFGVRTPRPRRRMHVVPFARLAAWHVAVRLRPLRSHWVDALCADHAATTSAVENAVSQWVHRFLDIGRSLDHALNHGRILDSGEDSPGLKLHAETAVDASVYDAIRIGCDEFQARLEAIAVETDPAPFRGIDAKLAAAHHEFAADCDHVDTFMLDPARRESPLVVSRAEKEEQRRATLWPACIERIRGRIELGIRLESFRQDSLNLHDRFIGEIRSLCDERMRKLMADGRDVLAGLRDGIDPVFERARPGSDTGALAGAIRALAADATGGLERSLGKPFRRFQQERAVEAAAERCVDGLIACVAGLPAVIAVQEPSAGDEPIDPDGRVVRVRLRQHAEQAWDAVLLEQIRTSVRPFQEIMDRITDEITQIQTVIRFNIDASIDELSDEVTAARLDGARELALNGFDRSIASLDSLAAAVTAAFEPFVEATFEIQCRGWDRLDERIGVEDRMQEQLLDLGYRTRLALRNAVNEGTAILNRAVSASLRQFELIRKRVRELVRIGQSAVEGERATRADMQRTIDALSNIDSLLAGLPLVYRRLFSFQPVVDPVMLEGRRPDLDEIAHHYQHWRDGITDALVITGSDCNGLTSFVNVACRTLFADADVSRITLDSRIDGEAEAVARISEALGIPLPTEPRFDTLSRVILEHGRGQRPAVCVVENLEHLFLRTASGNGVLGTFVSFMSHTDSCILWIGIAGNPMWNFFERVEPTTARLAQRHVLAPLDQDVIEALILNRHMRSGLPLRFVAPRVSSTLLRRRLSRAGTEQDRQAILRTDYFERLFRVTGENVLLSLFYWLRSARIDEGSESLLAQPVEPLSFGYLESLTLQQSFSLKAFFDHGTLTLDDHDRIFQMDHEASRQIFESLGNLLLIEPTDQLRQLANFTFSTINDERRYRIRPLVVHPVLLYLRSRNMID
jgi:hypothetical protein